MSVDIVTVSSKGQLVLPVDIRKRLAIDNGTKLAVYSSEDFILLKPLNLPTEEEFVRNLDTAKRWATDVGYHPEDVNVAIKSVRSKRRA